MSPTRDQEPLPASAPSVQVVVATPVSEHLTTSHARVRREEPDRPVVVILVALEEVPELAGYDTEGPIARMKSIQKFPTPRGVVDGYINSDSFGPGLSVVHFGGIVDTILMGCNTPIDDEHCEMRFSFTVRKLGDAGFDVVEHVEGGLLPAVFADESLPAVDSFEVDRGLDRPLGHGADGMVPGLLVPPDAPESLGASLRAWLTDPGLRTRLRHAAGQRRTTLSGWSVTVEQVSQVLMETAARSR